MHVPAVARVNLLLQRSAPAGSPVWVDSAGAGPLSIGLVLSHWDEALRYGRRDAL